MRFRLIKDLTINTGLENITIYKAGTIFEKDINGLYTFEYLNKTIKRTESELLEKSDMFEKIEELVLNITENTDTNEKVSNWRIQLDVKTTLSKLKEIERFLKDNLHDYL